MTFKVRVVPPEVGENTLSLFGKARDYLHAKFRKLVDYTLRCNDVYPTPTEFPDHKKVWGPDRNYAELGFTDAIQSMSVFSRDFAEMSIELEQTRLITILAELKASSDDKKELDGYTMESYGSRMDKLGDLKADGECVFFGTIKTPGPGKTVYISGSAAPPNVFWSRLYEYVTK
ncbi:hypothetical protein DPMN_033660 [Dreissena polymorpha]|uniref:Uncharacterized protein n=1 Tax=Dreissena polymorpha TaxID=45954 RepID=A0A9D4M415_DREPO|nr:hypothetical protein DPMN_033660 [Dreissena polymorpha]